MSEQEFLRQRATRDDIDELSAKAASQPVDIADLLDQIDGVLEKNAQEFVDNFVQKGGQ
jgi:ubiquitin-like protein Pup